jgi:hypothetical protein
VTGQKNRIQIKVTRQNQIGINIQQTQKKEIHNQKSMIIEKQKENELYCANFPSNNTRH